MIEWSWSEYVWNPVRGCTKVSAGCKNCYAERFAERFRGVPGHPFEQGFDVRLVPEALHLPLRWRKPRRIFVNSMSDLFHEDVPDAFVLQVFDVIRRCYTERPGHVFQVLTKRAERMADFCARLRFDGYDDEMWLSNTPAPSGFAPPGDGYALVRALTNLWLGVSVENQAAADERIPHLLATPAAVRFLSCEPLLGPISIDRLMAGAPVDWIIIGGESGPGARPCDVAWIRSLLRQSREAGVPAFVKQLGPHPFERRATPSGEGYDPQDLLASNPRDAVAHARWFSDWTLVKTAEGSAFYRYLKPRDRKGGDPAEWPADLRVREWPSLADGKWKR